MRTLTTSKPTEVDGDVRDRNGAMKIAAETLFRRGARGASAELGVGPDVVDWVENTLELTSEVGRFRQLEQSRG
jgi:hypothetical protein